jgi:hypothetical protein
MRYFPVFIPVIFLIATGALAGWIPEVLISEPVLTYYPDMASAGDTVHVVYVNSTNGVGYVRTTDGGDSWSQPIELSDSTHSSGVFSPKVIVSGSNVIVIWHDRVHGTSRRNIGYAISYDYGATWSEAEYIFSLSWEHILTHATAGNDSTINVIFSSQAGYILRFFNVRSTDFGETWSDVDSLFTGFLTGFYDMAAYGDYFHFVWYGSFIDGEMWETYYMRSTNGGVSWSENIPIGDIDTIGSYWPTVTTNELGNVLVSWTDFRYSPSVFNGDIFLKFSYNHGQTWSPEQQITFIHEDARSDLFWVGDTVHVIWQRDPPTSQRSIYYMQSVDNGANWSHECRLDNDPDDSRFPHVAASNNRRYAVWADHRNYPQDSIFMGVYFTYYDEQSGVENNIALPENHKLITAYPNPFNAATTIKYYLPSESETRLSIYNLLGQKIETLFEGVENPGEHALTWDASHLPSGIYFARLETRCRTENVKMVLLK